MSIIKQDNAISKAHYDTTALELNIIYVLKSLIKENDPIGKAYHIPLGTLKKRINNVNYDTLNESTKSLITKIINIRQDDGKYLITKIITYAEYNIETEMLILKISSELLPYFVKLKEGNYTEFELDTILRFQEDKNKKKSQVLSPRLYEYFQSEKRSSKNFQKPIKAKVEDIQKLIKYEGGWTTFEGIIKDSQKSFLNHADLSFSYTKLKTGNKFTDIIFKVIRIHRPNNPKQLSLLSGV